MKHNLITLYILLFTTLTVFAQQLTVTGTVVDEDGIPLPGVNILIKNASKGTVSNFDGNFSIQVNTGETLQFSMTGMVNRNIKIESQKTLNIVLKTDIATLDEVVVIGYGSVARKDLTGAISTVKTRDIESAPVATFDQALAGRIAGVAVTADEGTPGSALRIIVRGGNSITGSNDPLYVVNGIPLEEFDPGTINTDDIESFQVLKDASATAIYGSRGANGVVVITTKKGSTNGITNVKLRLSSSFQTMPTKLNLLNPYEYVSMLENRSLASDNWEYRPNDPTSALYGFIRSWIDPELYRNAEGRNFQKEAFRQGLMNRANFSISGGGKDTNVFFSAGVLNQEGIIVTTGYDRVNLNFTLRHKISDKLNFTGSAWYTRSNRNGTLVRESGTTSLLRAIIAYRPISPINLSAGEGEDGYIPGENDDEFESLYDPLRNLRNTQRVQKDKSIRFNLSLNYNITKNLTFRTANGFNNNDRRTELFFGLDTQQGQRSANGINGRINNNERTTFSTSNTLNYKKKLGKNRINALLGAEYVDNSSISSQLSNRNLPTDQFGVNNLSLGLQPAVSTGASANKLFSYFSRLNYDYAQKYLLTATFRADASSKFRPEYRWGYFPSFSGVWRVSKENFMNGIDFINNLSFRGGWGVTGNNRVGDFSSINQFGITNAASYAFGDNETFQAGAIQTVLAVPDLRWESTKQTNIGLDFSLLNSRLSGTMNYYYKLTDDLLLNANMALSTGFTTVTQNIGSVSNEGWELELTGRIIDKKDFTWETNFNISTNDNRVVALNDGQTFIRSRGIGTAEFNYTSELGKPVGMMYGFEYIRLLQVEDFVYDPTRDSNPYILNDGIAIEANRTVIGPGMPIYVDQNNDGVIDQDDRTIIGDPQPKHFGGINNRFRYKNLTFEFLFRWVFDVDIFNANESRYGYPNLVRNNQSYLGSVANMWTPWNTDTDVATFGSNGVPGFPDPSSYLFDDRYVEDGSFIRLQTVNISYRVPLNGNESTKSKGKKNSKSRTSLVFTLSAQNLFTWSSYSGLDPEVSISRSALTPNLDFSAYPHNRTINLGVLANF